MHRPRYRRERKPLCRQALRCETFRGQELGAGARGLGSPPRSRGRLTTITCQGRQRKNSGDGSVTRTLAWPSKIETWSMGTPASSISTAKVSRNIWQWARFREPSETAQIGDLEETAVASLPVGDESLGVSVAAPEKVAWVRFQTIGNFARRSSATSAGSGT